MRIALDKGAKGPVLDCYAGSGTTLVACANMGIQAIGIEIMEKYCIEAVRRLRSRQRTLIEIG